MLLLFRRREATKVVIQVFGAESHGSTSISDLSLACHLAPSFARSEVVWRWADLRSDFDC